MSRRAWVGWLIVWGLLAMAVFGAVAVAAANAPVAAVNYEFEPSSITVPVGDTVVWTMSGDGHTVRSGTVDADNVGHPSDGPLDSGFKGPGESYSLTFAQAGTYEYFCEIHPEQMKGTITIVAAGATSARTPSVPTSPPVTTAGPPPTAAVVSPSPPGDATPTAGAGPFVVAGILIAIAIAGLTLAQTRR